MNRKSEEEINASGDSAIGDIDGGNDEVSKGIRNDSERTRNCIKNVRNYNERS